MTTSNKRNFFAIPAILAIFFALFLAIQGNLDAPVLYNSNAETLKRGETVCAFVDTKEGKKPCDAFTEEERKNMEQRWAE